MTKPAIKIIKRTAEMIREKTAPAPKELPSRKQVNRDLQNSVNAWIEERRRNTEIETSISHARLRDLMV